MWKPAGVNRYIGERPSREELERLTVDELIALSKDRVRRKKPFKAALVDYILSVGKLC